MLSGKPGLRSAMAGGQGGHGPGLAGWRIDRRCLQRHPEWWSLALSAMAWLILLAPRPAPWPGALCRVAAAVPPWQAMLAASQPAQLAAWAWMTLAMMIPLALSNIRQAALLSLWRRRQRAMGGFLTGYLACWLAAGLVLHGLSGALASWLGASPAAMALPACLAAMLWQLTPGKARALSDCHRSRSLAPSGWQADRDCIGYGLQNGCACVRSCWALMLFAAVADHHLLITVGVTSVAWSERYRRLPAGFSAAALLGLLALWYWARG